MMSKLMLFVIYHDSRTYSINSFETLLLLQSLILLCFVVFAGGVIIISGQLFSKAFIYW